ncbi:MAG: FAD-dependent oxidoreductase [Armatimonadota bacterium]
MPDLTTEFIGLTLKSPLIVASSGLSQDAEGVKRAEDNGAAAVVMKALFDEEVARIAPSPRFAVFNQPLGERETFTFYSYEQASTHGPEGYAEEIRRAKEMCSIPVIANVNCTEAENWPAYVDACLQAGADAIEMNVSCPHHSVAFLGVDVENTVIDVVKKVRAHTSAPIMVKLTPQLTSPINMVKRVEETGADAVTIFNRFTGLEIDVDARRPIMHEGYAGHGGPWAKNYVLRWISAMAPEVDIQISASGGVAEGADAVAFLLAGAQTVQVCTAMYFQGYEVFKRLTRELTEYMERHEIASVNDLRGLLHGTIKGVHEVDRRHEVIASIKVRGVQACHNACPLEEDAQGYINLIAEGKYDEALAVIKRNHPFPGVLGRCCHHPCEDACVRQDVEETLAIAALKRFAADHGDIYEDQTPVPPPPREQRVAIVGAGPAGLTAAYRLRLEGFRSTVFEKHPVPGGMLAVGVPTYRLPRDVVKKEIDAIERMGVEIRTGVEVGKDITIGDLREQGYKAIFLGTGAHGGRALNVPGGDLEGVLDGMDFLTRHNLGNRPEIGPRVVVIGGGDVAVDAARTAARVAPSVTIAYRRRREDMPGRWQELDDALEEGVELCEQLSPIEVVAQNGRLIGVRLARTEAGPPGPDGRATFDVVAGEDIFIEADTVILAIGQLTELDYLDTDQLRGIVNNGTIEADEALGTTAVSDIFAGGDVVTGPSTLVDAMAAGKQAALTIARYLRGEDVSAVRAKQDLPVVQAEDVVEEDTVRICRQRMPERRPDVRVGDFDEIAQGMPERLAAAEADRCLVCGPCGVCSECARLCPHRSILHEDGRMVITPECEGCGMCVLLCTQRSIELVPREDDGDEVEAPPAE